MRQGGESTALAPIRAAHAYVQNLIVAPGGPWWASPLTVSGGTSEGRSATGSPIQSLSCPKRQTANCKLQTPT